ncbi:hypothetical protein QBC37DRAFT_156958 [Rhypophila decipiens]|uniref:AA1-like domain-containing protein n=1 Tax=Rhypophila decipiens TaxID=261697 RepID=A0AAN6Y8X3_9PEZI|nr:hypothetical protein QBC37DRAFT_156958 [Rhypophila decipiens]
MIYTTILYLIAFLLPFAAAVPHGPPGPKPGKHHEGPKNACIATSIHDFSWSLSLEYHASYTFTTPAHQNSWGAVSFNLTNPAVDKKLGTVNCRMDSNRLTDFFYGDQWYPCTASEPQVAGVLPDTQFRFFTHTRFDLNQTWVCNECLTAKKQKPVKFAALATTQLEMKCTDTSWVNPNWTFGSGAFYSTRDVKCEPVKLNLKPYEEKLLL